MKITVLFSLLLLIYPSGLRALEQKNLKNRYRDILRTESSSQYYRTLFSELLIHHFPDLQEKEIQQIHFLNELRVHKDVELFLEKQNPRSKLNLGMTSLEHLIVRTEQQEDKIIEMLTERDYPKIKEICHILKIQLNEPTDGSVKAEGIKE